MGLCNESLGKYNFDSPLELIQMVLDRIKKERNDTDAIIMHGDFVTHGVSIEYSNFTQ
jgi:hypothetical protein